MGERMVQTTVQTPRSAGEEGAGGGAPDTGGEISLQPVVQPMGEAAVALQPMEQTSPLQPMEDPMSKQVGVR